MDSQSEDDRAVIASNYGARNPTGAAAPIAIGTISLCTTRP